MPDTPREGYAGIHSTACEQCVFGTGEHAEWCPARIAPRKNGKTILAAAATGVACFCRELGYKCPKCYAESCLCGGVGCNHCAPQGSY